MTLLENIRGYCECGRHLKGMRNGLGSQEFCEHLMTRSNERLTNAQWATLSIVANCSGSVADRRSLAALCSRGLIVRDLEGGPSGRWQLTSDGRLALGAPRTVKVTD